MLIRWPFLLFVFFSDSNRFYIDYIIVTQHVRRVGLACLCLSLASFYILARHIPSMYFLSLVRFLHTEPSLVFGMS
jgi:hypothetical protein